MPYLTLMFLMVSYPLVLSEKATCLLRCYSAAMLWIALEEWERGRNKKEIQRFAENRENCFSFKGTCGMDHVLAAVLAVYAKWVRSDGNSGLLLWMYVSDTVTGTAGDSWQWHCEQTIQELASALVDPPGFELPNTGMACNWDYEGLEMLPKCAFSLSDQCHFLYRNAHENPSGLCFVLGYQMGHCLHLCLWGMCLCLQMCMHMYT